jgi:hypothetical protein
MTYSSGRKCLRLASKCQAPIVKEYEQPDVRFIPPCVQCDGCNWVNDLFGLQVFDSETET